MTKYRYICFAMATNSKLKTSPKAKVFDDILQTNSKQTSKHKIRNQSSSHLIFS